MTTAIDLTALPRPQLVEPLTLAEARGRLLKRFAARCEELEIDIDIFEAFVESDPAIILIHAVAQEMVLDRAQRNDEAIELLLAYAGRDVLVHRAAEQNIEPHDDETENALRRRIQLAHERRTNAGTEGSYVFHALDVEGVTDATAVSPDPGEIVITVLSASTADPEQTRAAVESHLNHKECRQLGDRLTVNAAARVDFVIEAEITFYPGPAPAPILQEAETQLRTMIDGLAKLDHDISRSAIMRALHLEGVQDVQLISPSHNIEIGTGQVAVMTGLTLNEASERNV